MALTELEPNIPLLRKVVEWVEEQAPLPRPNPDRTWLQGQFLARYFACGTAMCVAGKVALDDGWVPAWESGASATAFVTKNGTRASVSEVAGQLLGLSRYERSSLFDGGNSAVDIRRIAEEIAGESL